MAFQFGLPLSIPASLEAIGIPPFGKLSVGIQEKTLLLYRAVDGSQSNPFWLVL